MQHSTFRRYLGIFVPVAVVAIAGAVVVGFSGRGDSRNAHANNHTQNSDSAIAFRNDVRKLWEDHVTWTRLAIIAIADGRPEQGATVDRLLQNQTDIGNAIKPYYGDAAGNQLTALLRDHIVTAAEIITDAKAGNTAGVNDAKARWYANGDAIATLLNGANPQQWPLDHMKQMMREHLDLTLAEAVAHLSADWPADVVAYDRVHTAILSMADMLSLGIINQFPKQFR
ncbi:MAG: hypothetical protein KGK07_02755 [Chloroflexota bacterium]|nr:hypothetical protein [Chloroflexota bacterium]